MADRVDIKTGYYCNNWCRFCVQAHNRHYGNRTTEEIKESLRTARDENVSSVVFTGGEFTIRKDAIHLVAYATKIGYKEIQLQSNGRMFSDLSFLKKLIEAGANQFSPALHGSTAEIHDYLTRAPGAYRQTTQGIKLIRKLKRTVITNSVIVKANVRDAPNLAKLLVELDVLQFQFAFVHAMGNAWQNYNSIMPIATIAAPYIKKGIKIGALSNRVVMAEAMPFCIMKGYERYVSELYIPDTIVKEKDFWVKNFNYVKKVEGKTLFPQCRDCRYRLVCEGPWREYSDEMGHDEFRPVAGKLVESKEEILNNTKDYPIIPEI